MLWFFILVTYAVFAEAFRHSVPVKYRKPGEIDVSQITFTTPSADVDYRPSINHLNYYNGKSGSNRISKPGLITGNEIFSPESNRAPQLFTPIEEEDSPFGSNKFYETSIKPKDIYKSKPGAPVDKYKTPDPSNIFKPVVGKVPVHFKQGVQHGNGFIPSVPESTTFRNSDYGTVIGAPPDILKQYSTKVPISPHQEFPSSNGNKYFQPQNQGFVPIKTSGSSNFFNSDLPVITDEDYKKFEKITETPSSIGLEFNSNNNYNNNNNFNAVKNNINSNINSNININSNFNGNSNKQQEQLYSKKANKKPVYPKKFSSSSLKKLSPKVKAKPVETLGESSSGLQKLKNKAPVSFYKEPVQSHSFSPELSSFNEPTGGANLGLSSFSEPSSSFRTSPELSQFTDSAPLIGGGGDRVEFQMYGMDGPHSYKFGYDTGKGYNRHFRFEERDSSGKVKGHYGYLDKDGKMRVMKYEADPHTGFRAGPMDYPSNDFN